MFISREDTYGWGMENTRLSGTGIIPSLESNQSKYRSTGLSVLSLPSLADSDEAGEEIYFPSYDTDELDERDERENRIEDMSSITEVPSATPNSTSACIIERSGDDTAARIQPSRHVDYLSHEWTEEDIWSSWKHLMSKGKLYSNHERLINVSWRTWEKRRRNLKTVSPETIKWLKDHDVTWLYGPLQPGCSTLDQTLDSSKTSQSSDSLSGTPPRKPSLKKQSLSQVMLRNSVSLLNQAIATSSTQKESDLTASYDSCMFMSPGIKHRSTAPPTTPVHPSPNAENSNWGTKSVRFHELVEQYITLASLSDDESEYHYVSDSDTDVFVMRKPTHERHDSPSGSKKGRTASKTIQKLPNTILKSPVKALEENSPTIPAADVESVQNISQERNTLASSPPLIERDQDSDGKDDNDDDDWKSSLWLHNRKDSAHIYHSKFSMLKTPIDDISRDTSFLDQRLVNQSDMTDVYLDSIQAPTSQDQNTSLTFAPLPYHVQLDAFSFDGTATQNKFSTVVISENEIDPFSNLEDDDEYDYWTKFNEPSSRPSSFSYPSNPWGPSHFHTRPTTSPISTSSSSDNDESENNKASNNNTTIETTSPRTSTDSGYGSDETWTVRDESQMRLKGEKEKGIRDWELHDGGWDEEEEAAWERGF